MSDPTLNQANQTPKRASLWLVIRAISLGLLGLRNHANYREVLSQITVGQAFLGGVIGVIIFTAFVIFLVTVAINYLQ